MEMFQFMGHRLNANQFDSQVASCYNSCTNEFILMCRHTANAGTWLQHDHAKVGFIRLLTNQCENQVVTCIA